LDVEIPLRFVSCSSPLNKHLSPTRQSFGRSTEKSRLTAFSHLLRTIVPPRFQAVRPYLAGNSPKERFSASGFWRFGRTIELSEAITSGPNPCPLDAPFLFRFFPFRLLFCFLIIRRRLPIPHLNLSDAKPSPVSS